MLVPKRCRITIIVLVALSATIAGLAVLGWRTYCTNDDKTAEQVCAQLDRLRGKDGVLRDGLEWAGLEPSEPTGPEEMIDVGNKIAAVGPKAIPHLVRTLDDPDGNVSLAAATSLMTLDPSNPNITPALVRLLEEGDSPAIRAGAAWTLHYVALDSDSGVMPTAAMDALIRAVSDEHLAVRLVAIRVLGDCKSVPGEVISALKLVAERGAESERQYAEDSLANIRARRIGSNQEQPAKGTHF